MWPTDQNSKPVITGNKQHQRHTRVWEAHSAWQSCCFHDTRVLLNKNVVIFKNYRWQSGGQVHNLG